MANKFAIHSVASSLMKYLGNVYPDDLEKDYPCNFSVLSSGELTKMEEEDGVVGLYLYRVTVNEHLRTQTAPNLPFGTVSPLALDLHFLITIWHNDAVAEHTICAWMMQELHSHPIMDVSSLSLDGGWKADEVVQIIPAELSNEDLMRIWDALTPSYHLSLSYIARVVRIDAKQEAEHPPVVATQYGYSTNKKIRYGDTSNA